MKTNRKNNLLLVRLTLTLFVFAGIVSCSTKSEKTVLPNTTVESWMMLPFAKLNNLFTILKSDTCNKRTD